jgi:diadenosine tetraphosphate (Ap4A) HIT family hydrolase
MFYDDYLKTVNSCPFCECKDRIFIDKENAFLTYARAPYHPDHLLVVPKRHITSFFELNEVEKTDIDELLKVGSEVLKKLGYTNFSILVREGDAINKSIPHLHYHLIPNDRIGDLDHNGEPRQILSLEEITILSKRISDIIN